MPAALPSKQAESEDAEGASPEPRVGGVYLRPCNPTSGTALSFDLVDVLFRGQPARRQVRLQQAVLSRWAEKNAPGTADEIAALSARLSARRGPVCGLALDRPHLMGVLNVTPDSFSDGGDFAAEDEAIAHGRAMAAAGADIIDVGGESTRPGSQAPSEAEELRRVIPVIRALAEDGILVSIDTRRAAVMDAALDAGARIVNDISALSHDPRARAVAVKYGAWVILSHMQGTPETMQREPRYEDASLDVFDALAAQISVAEAAGIPRSKIIIDPGIGFGKTARHNLEILRDVALFHSLGCPLLVGASRKSFIGRLSAGEAPKARLPGSLAAGLHALGEGAHILRVHDVAETRQALAMWRGIRDPEAAVQEILR
ncbi:MAG: dihydropteroate synthase [Rhodospirillales bacterium]|nr:dihydropteroate synthase [Rhodospirillales bacterium]